VQGLGPAELRELYENFAPVVHRRALAILGRDADAWDAVQEVFRRVLESPGQFRKEARPMTYLYRATTNVCLNVLRGRAVRERTGDAGPEPTVEPQVDASEARELVSRLGRELDDAELQIAILHFLDGLTQEEISLVVGLSRKTVGRKIEAVRRAAASLTASEVAHG